MPEQRKDLDAVVLDFTYTYNQQGHEATKLPLFSPALDKNAPRISTVCPPTFPDTVNAESSLSQCLRLLQKATLLTKMANENLWQTQATYKVYRDRCLRFEPTFATRLLKVYWTTSTEKIPGGDPWRGTNYKTLTVTTGPVPHHQRWPRVRHDLGRQDQKHRVYWPYNKGAMDKWRRKLQRYRPHTGDWIWGPT